MPNSPTADVFSGSVINVKHCGAKGNGTDDTDELEACGVSKHRSHCVIIRICRRNRVLTPHTDDAEKLRG
jgi:hypothetical protein